MTDFKVTETTELLAPGDYYISDLCYIIGKDDDSEWQIFVDALYEDSRVSRIEKALAEMNLRESSGWEFNTPKRHARHALEAGHFILHAPVPFVVGFVSTAYGDGRYRDNLGNYYPVDAGMIGCVPVNAIAETHEDKTIHTFDKPFKVSYEEEGLICFGDQIKIQTGEEEEEEFFCEQCDAPSIMGDYLCHNCEAV